MLTEHFLDDVEMEGSENYSKKFRTSFNLIKGEIDKNKPLDQYIAIVSAAQGKQKRVKLKQIQMKIGCAYEGEWKNAKRDGQGRNIWPDGSIYDGFWVENKANGFGKLIQLVDRELYIYERQWSDNMANGKGVHIAMNGSKYEGEWKNDRKHGQGKELWPDGSAFIGSFENGKKNGYGEYLHADGTKTEGYWFKGKQHGQVMRTLANKGKQKGIWYNGKRIRWLNVDEELNR